MDQNLLDREVTVCKALASPVRLGVLDMLSGRACSASELQQALGIAAPNLSQQLAVLKAAGLIQLRRVGRHLYIALASPAVAFTCEVIREMLRQINAGQAALYNELAAGKQHPAAPEAVTGADVPVNRVKSVENSSPSATWLSDSLPGSGAGKFSDRSRTTRVGSDPSSVLELQVLP